MHELSIALNLIDVATEEAAQRQVTVVALHLRVGVLSGVVRDALESAFEIAREGTAMAAVRLQIEEVPLRMQCPTCQAEQPVVSLQQLRCSVCGAPATRLTTGRELELTALEVE